MRASDRARDRTASALTRAAGEGRLSIETLSLRFDGAFGARTREMIAAWQQAQKHPATGYLTAADSQALRDASPPPPAPPPIGTPPTWICLSEAMLGSV